MVAPIQHRTLMNPADVAAGLSPRERQTLALFLRGRSDKEVARALSISVNTVHEYAKRLHQEFEVCSRAELLSLWVDPTVIDQLESTAELDVSRRRFRRLLGHQTDAETAQLLVLRRCLLSQVDAIDRALDGRLGRRSFGAIDDRGATTCRKTIDPKRRTG